MKLTNILNSSCHCCSYHITLSHFVFKTSTFRHHTSLTLIAPVVTTVVILPPPSLCLVVRFTQPRQQAVQSGPFPSLPGNWHSSLWFVAFNQTQILNKCFFFTENHFRSFWLNLIKVFKFYKKLSRGVLLTINTISQ